jgi:hypothetical protein
VRELPGYLVPEISLGADGEDRAADRVGLVRAVLLGVGLTGAVHLQDGPGAARLLDVWSVRVIGSVMRSP